MAPPSTPVRAQRSGYLPSLDGWRAFAIIGVLLYHDRIHHLGRLSTRLPHQFGDMGVALFFGISGLLITSRILEEEQLRGAFDIRGFYVRRAFRILPAALVYLAFVVVAHTLIGLPLVVRGVAEALAFIRNIANTDGANWGLRVTEHFWSLSIEEQFYLFLPGILLFVSQRRLRLVLLFSLGEVFYIWTYYAPSHLAYYTPSRGHHTELNLHGLLFGAALAVLTAHPEPRARLARLLRPDILLPCAVLVLIFRFRLHIPSLLWLTAAFPLFALSTVLHPRSLATRLLEWPPLRFIGRMSYSIYLWQQVVFIFIYAQVRPSWTWLERAPWTYLVIFSFAAASFYLVEKPAIRLGHRLAPPPLPGRPDLHEQPALAA